MTVSLLWRAQNFIVISWENVLIEILLVGWAPGHPVLITVTHSSHFHTPAAQWLIAQNFWWNHEGQRPELPQTMKWLWGASRTKWFAKIHQAMHGLILAYHSTQYEAYSGVHSNHGNQINPADSNMSVSLDIGMVLSKLNHFPAHKVWY